MGVKRIFCFFRGNDEEHGRYNERTDTILLPYCIYYHILSCCIKSSTGKVIEYSFSLLSRLSRYVNDGRVNIDNNLIENAIRPLALEEKTICSAAMTHQLVYKTIPLSWSASLPELTLEYGWRKY